MTPPLLYNINYMVLAQAANYAMPLILIPYLVRTLGLAGFGDFSVAQSIINVGIIVVQFGFNIYVTKDIAEKKAHGQSINEIVWATFTFQIALALALIVGASAVYAAVPARAAQLSFWYSFAWLGQAMFPVWYFQGSQYFKQLALLNFMLRAKVFVLVLLLIKGEEHLLFLPMIYSFSYLSTGLIACAAMWRGHALHIPTVRGLVLLLNNTKDLFLSNIVSVLLMNMPVFFLGHQVSKEQVGAFSAILRVIYAIKGMLNSGFQVLIPTLISERDRLEHKSIVVKVVMILLVIVSTALAVKGPIQALLYGQRVMLEYDLEYIVLFCSVVPGSLATLFMYVFVTYHGEFVLRRQAFSLVFVIAALLYYPFIYFFNGLGAALVILMCETALLVLGIRIVWKNKRAREEVP
jgi:PST family polysaccharide transporter